MGSQVNHSFPLYHAPLPRGFHHGWQSLHPQATSRALINVFSTNPKDRHMEGGCGGISGYSPWVLPPQPPDHTKEGVGASQSSCQHQAFDFTSSPSSTGSPTAKLTCLYPGQKPMKREKFKSTLRSCDRESLSTQVSAAPAVLRAEQGNNNFKPSGLTL